MLIHGEVNPLNVFGLRRLDHCPPHFEKILFDLKCEIKIVSDWIYTNLEGRFYLGDHSYSQDGVFTIQTLAAFERASDASYLGLMLDQINKSLYDF
jgi:hypothetical protein